MTYKSCVVNVNVPYNPKVKCNLVLWVSLLGSCVMVIGSYLTRVRIPSLLTNVNM
jgi:hypothetical protein